MITMVLVTFTQTQGWLSYLMGDRGSIRWPILRFNGWRSHANFDGDDDDDDDGVVVDDGDSSVQWVTVPRQLWSQPISVMLRTTANIVYTQKDIIKYTWNVYLDICEFVCSCLCVFEYLCTKFDPSQSQAPHIQLRTDRWKENWKSRVEKCQSNPLSSDQPHHYKTVNPTSSPLRPPIRTVASIKDISMELVGQSL